MPWPRRALLLHETALSADGPGPHHTPASGLGGGVGVPLLGTDAASVAWAGPWSPLYPAGPPLVLLREGQVA